MYQTAAEIRAAVTTLSNTTTYPDAALESLVLEFERVAEEYRGVAFEPRYSVESHISHGQSRSIALRHPKVRAVASFTIDGSTITSDTYVLDKQSGILVYPNHFGLYPERFGVLGYPLTGNAEIIVTYTHGFGYRRVADGVTTNTSVTVTSATAAFTDEDVGEIISGSGIPVDARVIARASATSVTISAPATASASGLALVIAPNQTLIRACRQYVRSCAMADNSTVPRDVIGQSFEGNYTRYSTPDAAAGRPTGYLEVDRLLNSLPDFRIGVA